MSLCVCQCMDLAEYRTLFVLSFTTPAFDPDVAPSFGTLLATINVALSMLGEVHVHCFECCSQQFAAYRVCCFDCVFLFVDGEEERAGILQYSLSGLIG